MSDLHNLIMNIRVTKNDQNKAIDESLKKWKTYHEILVAVYQLGHRDARRAAADLAVREEVRVRERV